MQSLSQSWWGSPILPTGTGTRRIDYVYISTELIGMFQGVVVDDTQWPDHASVSASFRSNAFALERFPWFLPKTAAWPKHPWQFEYQSNPDFSVSMRYADFWNRVEQTASCALTADGLEAIPKNALGRGQTFEPKKTAFCQAPLRKSRTGELQPEFYGRSVKYAQLFKQARRLQSFVRALKSDNPNQFHHIPAVWKSICTAPGFHGGFRSWWALHGSSLVECSFLLHDHPPSLHEAESLYQAVQIYVKTFEKKLIRERVKQAKDKRMGNLNYVFRDCQRDQPTKIDVLIDSRQYEIIDINQDDSAIVVEPELNLLPDVPVCHHGLSIEINFADTDCIWVNDVTKYKIGDCIRQTQVSSEIPVLFEIFRKEWEPRWNRIQEILPSQRAQISNFAREVMPKTEWNFRDWDIPSFQLAVKSKKRTAATGPDGVSRSDLLALPTSVHQGIIELYREIETSYQWPQQLSVGIISSLEKKPGALQACDYRPIVIYPLLYRIWASYRAKDFLASFVNILPEGVRGGMPSRQAKSIWYETAVLLEQAHLNSSAYVGIVTDLSKAFNLLPREPIWVALDAMGVPGWFIRTWASFVTCQSRRFKIRDSVGPPIFSDVGFPEGCALSICSMAIIDALLDWWLRPVHPTIQVISYVDDWQVLHRAVEYHEQILHALWAFVDAVRMKIDRAKSFTWATSAHDRKHLRETTDMKVVLCAKELGAHLNFCKKRGNRSVLDRINAMSHTWHLLRSSLSPYLHKVTALRMLAWPRSLYGVSVVKLGPLNFGALRTGALRALRQDRIGSNPCLHLPLNGFTVDPEGYAILQTVKDARDHADADSFRTLLGFYCVAPMHFPQNGPVCILVDRLSRLGWSLQPDGTFCDSLGKIDVMVAHLDDLKFRIAIAWGWILTSELCHRKDFDGLQSANLGATCALLKKFSVADQIYLRCSLDGTMVTQKDRKHFQEGNMGLCPFCDQADSMEHRVWWCKEFDFIRKDFPSKFWPSIEVLPACTRQHAWAIRPGSYDEVVKQLESISDLPPSAYRIPKSPHTHLDLFCDGTCSSPDARPLRLAAWAVTIAHSQGGGYENDISAAGLVPGQHQSAFRAELYGFKHALAIASQVDAPTIRVWSDCQSVVTTASRIQRGLIRPKINGSHSDVWMQVSNLISQLGDRLVIRQVYAHNSISSGMSEIERWAYWHNSLTDAAAAKMNCTRNETFWILWKQAADDYDWYEEIFGEIAKLHVRIGKCADSLQKASKYSQRKVDTPEIAKTIVSPKQYVLSSMFLKKHGITVAQDVHDWWMNTGASFLNRSGAIQWISFTQLYIDFQLATGKIGPTYRDLTWYEDDTIFDSESYPDWGQFARWFQLMLKFYWRENGLQLEIKSGPPFSCSLNCWMVNVRLKWCPMRLEIVDQVVVKDYGVLRRGKEIRHLSRFALDSRMAVPLTNRG